MSSKPFKPTRLYIKRHRKTGLLYFGKTVKTDIIRYLGGGTDWNDHINKNGIELVEHVWNSDWFTDEAEIRSFALAFSDIFDIVRSSQWANRMKENGTWGGCPDTKPYRETDGTIKMTSLDDPRWATGEIVHACTGWVSLKDANGALKRMRVDDPDRANYYGVLKGRAPARMPDGSIKAIEVNDSRWASGEICGVSVGMAVAKDLAGNVLGRVALSDPRWSSGEIIGAAQPGVIVRAPNGTVYPTAKSAAKAHNTNIPLILRWARGNRNGWSLAQSLDS